MLYTLCSRNYIHLKFRQVVYIATTVPQGLKSRVFLQNISILGSYCCILLQINSVSELPDGFIFCHDEVFIIYQ